MLTQRSVFPSQCYCGFVCLFSLECVAYACAQEFRYLAKSNPKYNIVLISSTSLKAGKTDRASAVSGEAQETFDF